MFHSRSRTGVARRLVLVSAALVALGGVAIGAPPASAVTPEASAPAAAPNRSPLAKDTRATKAPSGMFRSVERRLASTPRVRVMVGLQTTVDGRRLADPDERRATTNRFAAAQADLVAANPWLRGRKIRSFEHLPYVAFDVNAAELRSLEQSGKAASVTESVKQVPLLNDSTGIVQSKAEVAHGFDGSGQTVAVLDTGVDSTHAFLAGRVTDEACFSSGPNCPNGTDAQTGPGSARPCGYAAGCAHGTHVAGIAAGKGTPATGGFDGVAPGAEILAISMVHPDKDETGTLQPFAAIDDEVAGLNYVFSAMSAGRQVAAVNISFGSRVTYAPGACPTEMQPVRDAINLLKFWGTATVFAAGNAGSTTGVSSPGCIDEAVTVGSTEKNDTVSGFSNSAAQVDLLAPGGSIMSSVPGGRFEAWSGTSMAAPHVAGAWAIYKERFPQADDVDAVLARMQSGGRRVTDTRNGLVRSRLDIAAATGGWAFVFAHDDTNPSYVPTEQFQASSTGAPTSVVRNGTGSYVVTMPGLGSGEESSGPFAAGNVQVSGYGVSTHRCKNGGAFRDGQDLQIVVSCFATDGQPTDGAFTLLYQSNEAVRTNQAAYVSAEQPTAASYTPNLLLQANSKGGLNTITRSGTGSYTVTFPGFTANTGDVQVGAIGSDSSYCKVRSWAASTATVNCYTATGAPVDTQFSLAYTAGASATTLNPATPQTAHKGAYVRADNATSTAWYTPNTAFSWTSGTGTIQARKTGTGLYEVRIPGMPAANATDAMVTAYGTSSNTCRPWSWAASGSDTVVGVMCHTAAGAAVDDTFDVLWSTNLV
jgi:subtilisin family serine protease